MLLSRKSGDPIVGRLRDKKEKRSTRSRLRVDSGIGSFFKLLEVGFSPYLGFTPILNVLLMFRLNEAVRGRLIGPKTWDRIVRNSLGFFSPSVTASRLLGAVWVWLVLTCALNVAWYALGREWPWISGSLSEPMLCDFPGIVNEGFTIPRIVF